MAKGNDTRMVRLSETTIQRLSSAIDEIIRGVEAGTIADPGLTAESINPPAKALSFDAMVSLLLDRRDAHKERGRKSREKAKQVVEDLAIVGRLDSSVEAALTITPKSSCDGAAI